MRGDYAGGSSYTRPASGPSPRAWGLLWVWRHREEQPRAIPTCVGTTPSADLAQARTIGPSPRAWGLPVGGEGFQGLYGPSPRAWGLRLAPRLSLGAKRAIPTCVGTTAGGPHVGRGVRAIPTCVGTTGLTRTAPPSTPGHPHVRGDYLDRVAAAQLAGGPSPRAWGLLANPDVPPFFRRAIPTCVGTTGIHLPARGPQTGHPHVRGDYVPIEPYPTAPDGPSPRAWGLLSLRRAGGPARRAIPTCVGTTRAVPGGYSLPSGHPHVRGDYGGGGQGRGREDRAIPTCVGTTR